MNKGYKQANKNDVYGFLESALYFGKPLDYDPRIFFLEKLWMQIRAVVTQKKFIPENIEIALPTHIVLWVKSSKLCSFQLRFYLNASIEDTASVHKSVHPADLKLFS